MQEKEIIIKGKKIFYRSSGQGPVVVLLHGFGEEGKIWSKQFDAFSGFQLIIPDLPGSGQSELIDDMSMEGMAECMKEMISPLLTSPNGGRIHTQASLIEVSSTLGGSNCDGEFYQEADPMTYGLLKNFVSKHRRSPTKAEAFLWEQLRNNCLNGYSFRRQHIIGNFIVDFVCLAKKLVIEIDGLIHQLPDHKISDEARTLWLQMKGYTVIRFTNEQVLFDLENTLNTIRRKLDNLSFAPKKNYETRIKSPHPNLPSKCEETANAQPLPNQKADKNKVTPTCGVSVLLSPIGGVGGGSKVSVLLSSATGEIRKGAVVIGHSMGGYVTLALAEKYPELLNGLGLFHSTAYADSEEKKTTRRKAIEFIQKYGAFDFLKTSIPNLYSEITKAEKKQLMDDQIAGSNNFSGDALVTYYEAMIQRPDRTEVLKNSKVPVLFVSGKYDNAVPLNDGLKQCSLPDLAYIHILESSGHMGMREEPVESNQLLKNYLKNICHQAQ